MTNGSVLRKEAEKRGIPLTSIWKAQEGLTIARKTKADVALARIMLRHGRLTDEARVYVSREYPQCAS